MSWRIPLSDLDYGPEEETAVMEVLRSRWLSMGPKTEAMEAAFADYLEVRHTIAVSNCTAALELVLAEVLCPWTGTGSPNPIYQTLSSGFRPLVLVPDLTFVATANAPFNAGARVSTADCAPGSLFPGPQQWETAWETLGTKPAAVIAVHYAGFDSGVEELAQLCKEWGCPLIEDAAHAIGGKTATGRMLGSIGLAGCFSFFSNKNLSTGEGGLIATNDDHLARALRLRRSHGMTSLTWQRHQGKATGYDVLTAGHNLRVTELTAALALTQLEKLEHGNAARRRLWRRYVETFSAHGELRVPLAPTGSDPNELAQAACHIFPLLAPNPEVRDRIRSRLTAVGIQTSHHYPPIHEFEFWSHHMADAGTGKPRRPRVNSADITRREVTLPLYPSLSLADQDEVIRTVLEAVS
jgi:dTDP-4-amino-4,6-dideoxygalactose transaminase